MPIPGLEATPERISVLWLLAAFVTTIALTRAATRYIRHQADRAPVGTAPRGPIRDILINGIHVHHQVWGIILILLVGFVQVAYRPVGVWADVTAAAFGAGAALTLDQFAMWLHLEDVYWSPEGRTSITALITTGAIAVAVLLGIDPLGLASTPTGLPWLRWALTAVIVVNLVSALVCLLKGKPWLSVVGVFVPGLAWAGALRLARPRSWWAARFYDPQGRRMRLARERQRRHQSRWDALLDLIGGPPSR
ncbi:hypothetical protein ADJ73_12710 [Arsenicicoccus sp. oral taxon 190]|nr:hypothetical protein ADJ73_12710 [Arsenicicoccus sp. oral taxon 190]